MVLESECPLYGGVCFHQLFYFLAPYSIFFCFFGTLGGLVLVFWVWFLSFENFENGFGIRMPTFGGVCFLTFFYWVSHLAVGIGCENFYGGGGVVVGGVGK